MLPSGTDPGISVRADDESALPVCLRTWTARCSVERPIRVIHPEQGWRLEVAQVGGGSWRWMVFSGERLSLIGNWLAYRRVPIPQLSLIRPRLSVEVPTTPCLNPPYRVLCCSAYTMCVRLEEKMR